MNRVIYSASVQPNHVVEVVFNFFDTHDSVVESADFIHRLTSIKKHDQISDGEIRVFNDFIESVYNALDDFGFITYKSMTDYPSAKGYSYYIHFDWITEDGTKQRWAFLFRISNHHEKHMGRDNPDRARKGKRLLRSIEIGPNLEFDTTKYAFDCILDMLEGISSGDISAVDRYYKKS